MLISSDKLRMCRQEKNWSQEVLAKASGLSLRTVQRIESGANASAESLLALASALEVSPQQLQVVREQVNANWTGKIIMQNFIALLVISAALVMLFMLAGHAKLFIDVYVLAFNFAFIYAATIIAFGVDGFVRAIIGLKYLFSTDIQGGAPAAYLAKIFQSQIYFCYGAAVIAFLIGCVAIHGNLDDFSNPEVFHRAYAVNLLALLYATILSEVVLRPLKTKLATCDLSN